MTFFLRAEVGGKDSTGGTKKKKAAPHGEEKI